MQVKLISLVLLLFFSCPIYSQINNDTIRWFSLVEDPYSDIKILVDKDIKLLSDTCCCEGLYSFTFLVKAQFDTCTSQLCFKNIDVRTLIIRTLDADQTSYRKIYLNTDSFIKLQNDCITDDLFMIQRIEQYFKEKLLQSNIKINNISQENMFFLLKHGLTFCSSNLFKCPSSSTPY